MLRYEWVTCKKCGKIFRRPDGGIVSSPVWVLDNVCIECHRKELKNAVEKLRNIFGKGDRG